jgi:hypothetical protein
VSKDFMTADRPAITEQIQRKVAHLVATLPVGVGLCLIGGFRYRLLDRGVRRSVDIDYHWEGDLQAKQRELVDLFERRLLPDVRRQTGLEGSVGTARGAAAESTAVAVVELAFWQLGSNVGRIEIPVEITRIECADPPAARTADGVVYRTASNADMFESKVIAIIGRTFVEHRDLLDLHLFSSHAAPDAATRLRHKLDRLGIDPGTARRRLDDLEQSDARHAAALDAVIHGQIDPASAATLADAGGGSAVLASARGLLTDLLASPRRWP